MRLLSIFKRHPESPAEKQALENLDEVTRDVGWQEFDKEKDREQEPGQLGPLTFFEREPRAAMHHVDGDPVPEPVDDPDPAGSGSLRDTLREDEN